MKALVVGCGSIGKRHINNLVGLDIIDSISVFTKNTQCLEDLKNKKKVNTIDCLSDDNFDFAVIANETDKHIDTAILLAEKGINLFIEKPISHSLDKVEALKKIVTEKEIKIFIAYNLRFLGAIGYIKKQLTDKVIGDPYFARIEAGQYLSLWRPDTDYRQSYSARKKRGGGVALDLSHEIDYMRYLFGDPSSWKVVKTKVSNLEIDSDDIFEGIYMFPNNFVCSVHLDYLQSHKKREIKIVGSTGSILCDLVKKHINITAGNRKTVIDDEEMFDIDKTYLDELHHFIKIIREDLDTGISLSDGITALRLVEDGNV